MKTASELHDEWARGRGIDSPEESQAKRKAYQDALEAEHKADEGGEVPMPFEEYAHKIGAEIKPVGENLVELVPIAKKPPAKKKSKV